MSGGISTLLEKARQRVMSTGAGHTADFFPEEAHRLLQETGIKIVDVHMKSNFAYNSQPDKKEGKSW